MATPVSDARSNANDQIAHASSILKSSKYRREVFRIVYTGKKAVKSVSEIVSATGFSRQQVLDAGLFLVKNQIVDQLKRNSETAYQKDPFYNAHRDTILRLSQNPKRLDALPTKTRPESSNPATVLRIPRAARVRLITLEDISTFSKAHKIKPTSVVPGPILEETMKKGFQQIVGEPGKFKDWGGEKNDLWTTRVSVASRRRATAIAFKGKGQKGKLTPAKLGKNADQIQRLFQTVADVYLVQYWGQIDQSVVEQMNAFSIVASLSRGGATIYYGVIDGTDFARMRQAYKSNFEEERK